jgi:hypothetical protein
VAEPTASLASILAAVRPALEAAGYEDAGSGDSGPYPWVRFRRQEVVANQRCVRLLTLSHAPEEQAFLADVYLVARSTSTHTPVARELMRYSGPTEAAAAAEQLAARVLSWLEG